jgi:hypothetical protein
MLRVRSVEIEVRILQKIENIQIEQEQMSRKDLCVLAEKRIEAEFKKRLKPLES